MVLHKLLLYWKMSQAEESQLYAFKLFKFEEIKSRFGEQVPHPRSGHRVVADSKNLYAFGGYNPDTTGTNIRTRNALFAELWKFNFATRIWTLYKNLENIPETLASNAVVRHHDLLMIYGGTGFPFGHQCSNQLHICCLSCSNSINQVKATGQMPLPQYGQALLYHNGYLYTIGGTTGFTYTCDIHRLNLKTLFWEAIFTSQGNIDYEPHPRYRHEIAFDGVNVYILGGGTSDEVYGFKELPVFNIQTRKWSKKKTLEDPRRYEDEDGYPAPRMCHGAVQLETEKGIKVFIVGGFDTEQIFKDLWMLELNTLQWTVIKKCRLPRALYFHSATVTPEGKLFVFGGIQSNQSRSNKVYSTWVCVPKLSEICWEAYLKYNPDVLNRPWEELASFGLPRRFIKRIELAGSV